MSVYPCKNCRDRHLACHDNCEKYKKVKQEKAEIKKCQKLYDEEKHFYLEKLRETRLKGRK